MRGSRDDASISKVVEWFRALALVLSFSLAISLASPSPRFSLSLYTVPSLLAIESLFVGEYVRGNLDLNYSQFSLSHFQLYLARPGLVGSRADDVSDRVSISRLFPERSRISAAFK